MSKNKQNFSPDWKPKAYLINWRTGLNNKEAVRTKLSSNRSMYFKSSPIESHRPRATCWKSTNRATKSWSCTQKSLNKSYKRVSISKQRSEWSWATLRPTRKKLTCPRSWRLTTVRSCHWANSRKCKHTSLRRVWSISIKCCKIKTSWESKSSKRKSPETKSIFSSLTR